MFLPIDFSTAPARAASMLMPGSGAPAAPADGRFRRSAQDMFGENPAVRECVLGAPGKVSSD